MRIVYYVGRIIDTELISKVRSLGYQVGFIGESLDMVGSDIELDQSLIVENINDLSDSEVAKLRAQIGEDGQCVVLATTDAYVLAKARISKAISTKSQTVESAEIIESKAKVRKHLEGLDNPYNAKSITVDDIEQAIRFGKEVEYPVILKPVNLNGSRHVYRIESQSELVERYSALRLELGEASPLLVEEFLQGPKISIEGIVEGDRFYTPTSVTDALSARDFGILDYYEYRMTAPSSLPDSSVMELKKATRSIIKDLGLEDCPIHAEFIVTKKGPKLIEIASRFGGLREKMYERTYGYSLVEAELAWLFDAKKSIELEQTKPKSFTSVYMIYSEVEGVLSTDIDKSGLEKLDSFSEFDMRGKIGDRVGLSKNGFNKLATLMLCSEDRLVLEQDNKWVENNLTIGVVKTTYEAKKVLLLTDKISPALSKSTALLGCDYLQVSTKKASEISSVHPHIPFVSAALDLEGVVEALTSSSFKPDAIYAGSEKFIALKASLCELFGIPFLATNEVSRVVEKSEMREMVISNDPDISPLFAEITSEDELLEFADRAGYPLILKPSGLDSSLLIEKVATEVEAKAAFKNIHDKIEGLYATRRSNMTPTIIAEQYLEGLKYSVEAIVLPSGEVVLPDTATDLIFGYDVGKSDPANLSSVVPSGESKELIEELQDVTIRSVKALGLHSCTIHAELIHTPAGVKLIEVAGRIGGFRESLYRRAFGYSMFEQDIRMQLGWSVGFEPTRSRHLAITKLYPEATGKFVKIDSPKPLDELASFSFIREATASGEEIGLAKNGYVSRTYVVLESHDRSQVIKDRDYILKNVSVVIED